MVAPTAIATYRSGMADWVATPCEWGDGCEEPAAVELTGTIMRPSTIQGDEVHALDAGSVAAVRWARGSAAHHNEAEH